MEAPLPLSVARSHVHQAEWRCLSVLPELYAGRRPGRAYRRTAAGPDLEFEGDAGDAPAARCRTRRGSGHLLALLHHDPASRAGDREPGAAREDGSAVAAGGGTAD